MQSLSFMRDNPQDWPLFTSVPEVRSKFAPGTKVMIAIGGWGDTQGFSQGAATEQTRKHFAQNVKSMLKFTGADGVDVDWEYPGGNGEDYKNVTNGEKVGEIDTYPALLAEIRSAIGHEKFISVAVPGRLGDMIAFTATNIPKILPSVDFFNIMAYDLFNRRDNVTKHHTGISLSLEAIDEYLKNGVPPEKANLGFAFYVRWAETDPRGGCHANPIGCKTVLMEDPVTGADLGKAGAFAYPDDVRNQTVWQSYLKAQQHKQYDTKGGGNYYWDSQANLWWTWDTPHAMLQKFPQIVTPKKLGGVFAWALGGDYPDWVHLKALTSEVKKCMKGKVLDPSVRKDLEDKIGEKLHYQAPPGSKAGTEL